MQSVPIKTYLNGNVFGIASKPFEATKIAAAGGLGVVAIFSIALTVGFVVAGVTTVVIAVNAINGIYGDKISKYLNEEQTNGKEKSRQRTFIR